MTVIIRKIKTALQREYRKAGGILVSEAIAGAEGNLNELSVVGMEQIDLTLERVSALTANPTRRPTADELRQIHSAINEMLSFCATVQIDGFAETLHASARLVGALMLETNDEWAVARRYMSLETIARVTDNPTVRLPAVAA